MERTPMQHSSNEPKYICIMIQWLDNGTQQSCPWRTVSTSQKWQPSHKNSWHSLTEALTGPQACFPKYYFSHHLLSYSHTGMCPCSSFTSVKVNVKLKYSALLRNVIFQVTCVTNTIPEGKGQIYLMKCKSNLSRSLNLQTSIFGSLFHVWHFSFT